MRWSTCSTCSAPRLRRLGGYARSGTSTKSVRRPRPASCVAALDFLLTAQVKDLDRFELGLQAVEYEGALWPDGGDFASARSLRSRYMRPVGHLLTRIGRGVDGLTPFLQSTQPHIAHAEVKRWSTDLCVLVFVAVAAAPLVLQLALGERWPHS